MSQFSGALQLTDLNDYITPSQACVKPLPSRKGTKQSNISLTDDGIYVEVTNDGTLTELDDVKISLQDCLACSGCVTSAESVLITAQSKQEFTSHLNKDKVVVVSVAPQARASLAAEFGLSNLDTLRKLTTFLNSIGVHHVFDTSFSRVFSLLESQAEFVDRYRNKRRKEAEPATTASSPSPSPSLSPSSSSSSSSSSVSSPTSNDILPILASSCPGWVCYAEKTHGEYIIPYMSTAKSPQQVMGSIVKHHFADSINKSPGDIYHVAVMPCYDKKLEASREDFFNEAFQTREVDCVLTSNEVLEMVREAGVDFGALEPADLPSMYTEITPDGKDLYGVVGGSGGYANQVFQYAARELFGQFVRADEVVWKQGRNGDMKEATLQVDGVVVLRFAQVYGFRNIQNLVRGIKRKRCKYDYVEVMACPSGCLNGGGQIKPSGDEGDSMKERLARVQQIYERTSRPPEASGAADGTTTDYITAHPVANRLYAEWYGGVYSEKARLELHTSYHMVEKMTNGLTIQW